MLNQMRKISTADSDDWLDEINETLNLKMNENESERMEIYFDSAGVDDLLLTSNEKYKLRYNFVDLTPGMSGSFVPFEDNLGAMTISIDDHEPLPFKDSRGLDFVGGEIKAGRKYSFFYTGVDFRLYDIPSATESKRGVVEIATQDEVENGVKDNGTEGSVVVTPETLEGRRAHETNHGLVEIATQQEVEDGTGTPDRGAPLVVTPQTLEGRRAHETNHGLVEIATQQEVEDGTGTPDRGAPLVVTPQTLEGRRAHETNHGLVEIATQQEVEDGTGTPDRGAPLVVTPQTLEGRKAHEGNHGLVEIATQDEVDFGKTTSDRGGELAVTAEKLDARKATDTNHGLVEIATQAEVEAGTGTGDRGAEVVVTPYTLEGRRAHETNHGLVEIATQQEVEDGTGIADRGAPLAVTVQTLHNRKAHEGNHGLIEIATQAEMNAGTDDERAVTPLKITVKLENTTISGGEGIRGQGTLNENITLDVDLAPNPGLMIDADKLKAIIIDNLNTDDSYGSLSARQGKLLKEQIDSIMTALIFRGSYPGNSGSLPTATEKNEYWIINTSAGSLTDGTTTIDVEVGDWVIHDGTNWHHIDLSNAPTLAERVLYDNSNSDFTSTNVKAALDESSARFQKIEGDLGEVSGLKTESKSDTVSAINEVHDERDALQTSHDTLRGEHDTLRSDHDTLRGEHDTLRSDHDTLRGEHDTLDGEVGEVSGLKTEVKSDTVSAINEIHDERDALQVSHDTLRGEHDTLRSDHDTLRGEHDTLDGEVGEVSGLKTESKSDVVSAINEVHDERDALQTSHDTLRGEHDTLRSEHDTLKSDHDTLRGEHDALDLVVAGKTDLPHSPGNEGLVMGLRVKPAGGVEWVQLDVPVRSVSIGNPVALLNRGDTYQITWGIDPSYATNLTVSFSSTDSGVASVDPAGLITAVDAGICDITVTTDDGGRTDTFNLTVEVRVESVSIDNKVLIIDKGTTHQLAWSIVPPDSTDPSVSFSSTDEAVATVTPGGLITAVDAGSCDLTVTTTDGDKTDTFTFTVEVRVTGVTIDNKVSALDSGATHQTTWTVSPADATDPSVSFSSSDEGVATVDASGLITAVGNGTATITATTAEGSFTDTMDITVTTP